MNIYIYLRRLQKSKNVSELDILLNKSIFDLDLSIEDCDKIREEYCIQKKYLRSIDKNLKQ